MIASIENNKKVKYVNGTLNIDSELHDLLYIDNESYIDASVIHDKVYGYLLAVKKS